MNSGALVIGGSDAGIQAALDLADSGIPVQLITASAFLSAGEDPGRPPHIGRTRLLEIAKHPRISVWTNTRLREASEGAGGIQIELQQEARYVDLGKCTACGDCIEACPVSVPGTDHKAIYLPENGQPQCAAIDKQGRAPCTDACPGGIPVQGYVALIARGRYREALDLIEAAIPFAGICGRVCTHPCEDNCRRGEVDGAVSIRALKRFVADWAPRQPQQHQSAAVTFGADANQVAVVGSGPAGMTVADRLSRLGHRVTIFEKLPVIAGMMGIGIPAYRLPRDVIAREYRRIQSLGVDICLNTAIGPGGDHSIDDLFAMGFKAVCLCIGAHKSLKLHIPGEGLRGVVQGIDLLKAVSLSQQLEDPVYRQALNRLLRRGELERPVRTVVIGGGNTAIDAARSLKRLGVSEVRILYRRSRAQMPALAEEVEAAAKEGIPIDFLVAPVRVLGSGETGVRGIECVRMQLTEPDADGRLRPAPIAHSEFQLDVELIVPAIGQVPDLDDSDRIGLDRAGRVQVHAAGFMTERPGVFAAGDAVTQDKMAVIEAIGMGKKAAAGIAAYLNGVDPNEPVKPPAPLPVVATPLVEAAKTPAARLAVPMISLEKRLGGFQEVETGYTEQQAHMEAQRCLSCGPCSECLACVAACKPEALDHLQRDSVRRLAVGAVIYAEAPEGFDKKLFGNVARIHRAEPESALQGSAAAAQAMFDLFTERRPVLPERAPLTGDAPVRLGVFICRCGEKIAGIVDTQTLGQRAAGWPEVVFTGELRLACSAEAAGIVRAAARDHRLDRIVLAACACCAIDQVCFSCTYQRVRCKQNLGIFGNGLPPGAFEFVNIREQCAWIHADDPKAATAKATALVAAAVAKARLSAETGPAFEREQTAQPTVLVVGAGKAAAACLRSLSRQGIPAFQLTETPGRIRHIKGRYSVSTDGETCAGTGVVLAPRDAAQLDRFKDALASDDRAPDGIVGAAGCVAGPPGIFYCSPDVDPATAGLAAAAQAAAWLGRLARLPALDIATTDPDRCRACRTCITTCEIGAPVLIEENARRFAWIDPSICTGCGGCAAGCPTGAIRIECATDAQLTAAIDAVLTQ